MSANPAETHRNPAVRTALSALADDVAKAADPLKKLRLYLSVWESRELDLVRWAHRPHGKMPGGGLFDVFDTSFIIGEIRLRIGRLQPKVAA